MRIAFFFSFAFVFFWAHAVKADPPKDAVLLDGLTTLVGGRAANESDSSPVLLSDVEFQAKLVMFYRSGADTPLTDEVRSQARRIAVIVTILAAQARQLQETPKPGELARLRELFEDRVGGREAMERLLTSFGMTGDDLKKWLGNVILASKQISYVEAQVELPSDEEITAKLNADSESKGDGDGGEHYEELRRQIVEDRLVRTVKTWLYAVLESANVRVVK